MRNSILDISSVRSVMGRYLFTKYVTKRDTSIEEFYDDVTKVHMLHPGISLPESIYDDDAKTFEVDIKAQRIRVKNKTVTNEAWTPLQLPKRFKIGNLFTFIKLSIVSCLFLAFWLVPFSVYWFILMVVFLSGALAYKLYEPTIIKMHHRRIIQDVDEYHAKLLREYDDYIKYTGMPPDAKRNKWSIAELIDNTK